MSTNPLRPIGFRKSEPFVPENQPQPNLPDPSHHVVGWRFWIGPLLVARTPGIRPGIHIGWTR